MAFGASSKIFSAFPTDSFNGTALFDLNSHAINVALFGNGVTPDPAASSAATQYGAGGTWTAANEVTATGWTAGGLTLAGVASGFASNVYTFDATDKAGGAADTVTNAYGVLIFDNTLAAPVAKQGICYNAFGGAASVTSGTFTVVFNGSGIFTLTL
jgi:hypothetical protein